MCLVLDITTLPHTFTFFPTPGTAESRAAPHQLQTPRPSLHNICPASCAPSHGYGLPCLGAGVTLVRIQSHPTFSARSSDLSRVPCTRAVFSGVLGSPPLIIELPVPSSLISVLLAMSLKNASDDSRYRRGPKAEATHPPFRF